MARQRTTDFDSLWRAIEQAGSVEAYIDGQLREHGFLVERRDTDNMSKRELATYKKQLKQEAAEKRRVRHEAWQAYKANHIVHLGEGVYWNDGDDWDKWDLENAEERAAENELPPLDSPKQLAKALGISVAELRWLAYHREAATVIHYRRFTIPKRNGTPRPIWAPLPKIKAAQHWILREVLEKLLVHGAVHGFLAGRSIASNARLHTNSQLILKMDLENFFPTITMPRARGVFRKAGYRDQIATLLALLCTESPREITTDRGTTYYLSTGPRCLPQGAPTSPALTNIVGLKLDRRLTGIARKLGWRYSRYADDLTFSLPAGHQGKPQLGTLLGVATRIVDDEGFKIRADKTRVARSGARQKVTGLVVNGLGPPRVPRARKRQLRAAIHNLKQGKPLQAGETLQTLIGYAAFIHMTEPGLGTQLMAELKAFETNA